MTERARSIALFAAGLLIATATTLLLVFSIGMMRQSVLFGRALRDLQRDGANLETLTGAAEFARSRDDWRQLLQIAWRLDDRDRWVAVRDVARLAMDSRRQDDTWALVASFAAVNAGDAALGRLLLPDAETPGGETMQLVRLFAALAEPSAEIRTEALDDLSMLEQAPTATAVATAVISESPTDLARAWREVPFDVLGVQGAVRAAAQGDNPAASEFLPLFDSERQLDPRLAGSLVYIAAWLERPEDVARLLRQLPVRVATSAQALLLQADAAMQLQRMDEAQRIYRELQSANPETSALIYANDAVIAARAGDDEQALQIALDGVSVHPEHTFLREVASVLLYRAGEGVRAARMIAPVALAEAQAPPDQAAHRRWLYVRTILGRRLPIERLLADLWLRLNDYPDAAMVAAYLARISSVRDDEPAMSELLRRPAGQRAWWNPALAGRLGDQDVQELGSLSRILGEAAADSPEWRAHYNLALFALRHEPLPNVGPSLDEFAGWLDVGSNLSIETESVVRVALGLLRAEARRTAGDIEGALAMVEQLITLNPDMDELYGYRALVASAN